MGAWLDRIPYPVLILAALMLGAAPFMPEPHLVQKARMFMEGTLTRPEDIFDVIFHAAPLLLIVWKMARGHSSTGAAGKA